MAWLIIGVIGQVFLSSLAQRSRAKKPTFSHWDQRTASEEK